MEEHAIYKACKKQDPAKYASLSGSPTGVKKICCYVVKILIDNNISTFYPNICVALWRMFPEIKIFQLEWFEDFPDTDKMEKYIKLYSTPKAGNYLIGGNPNAEGDKNPWLLTEKGKIWAEEVEAILTGKKQVPKPIKAAGDDQTNYDRVLQPVLYSKLMLLFAEELKKRKKVEDVLPGYVISKERICGALRIFYPQPHLDKKIEAKVKYYQALLERARKDGIIREDFETAGKLLKWIGMRKIDAG